MLVLPAITVVKKEAGKRGCRGNHRGCARKPLLIENGNTDYMD
jgi:hypothetical protein